MSLDAPAAPVANRTPSLRRRMACFVYESLVLFGLGLVPGAFGALMLKLTGEEHPITLMAFAVVFYGLYFTGFWAARGQTLPMQTWGVRVVTADGAPLGRARALARYAASFVWVVPGWAIAHLLGWRGANVLWAVGVNVVVYALLAFLNPQRQFWHDIACGTRLVTAPLRTPRKAAQPQA